MLSIQDPNKYVREGDSAPNIHPMPSAALGASARDTARNVWRRWHGAAKTPLLVTARVDGRLEGEAHLDALLGVGVGRMNRAPWRGEGREAWVVPLPVALLGVVPVPRKASPPRLPIWATTPLVQEAPDRLEALCIGDEALVRAALAHVGTVGNLAVLEWLVRPAPLGDAETREIILDTRPLPETHDRFCPPYWHDWRAEAST